MKATTTADRRRAEPEAPPVDISAEAARSSEPVELAPTETAGQPGGETVALGSMAPARRAVLSALKAVGEASAEELASRLGVTVAAVRQQIATLQEAGLVAHRDERPGPGRPRRRYCLAPATEALWPKRYGQLANQLLGYIGEVEPALIDQAFENRRKARIERARARLGDLPLDQRVEGLAAILDEDGYLASWEQLEPGRWRIVEHNCAILDVAQQYGKACTTELAFLREVLADTVVERTAHMLAGAHVCAYEISRPE